MLTRRTVVLGVLAGLGAPAMGATSGGTGPRWDKGPALPLHVQEIYPVLHGGRIHVAGGFRALLGQIVGPTDSHHALDPGTGNWEEMTPLPQALHHPQLVSFGGALYCLGGFLSPGPSRIWVMTGETWVYDESAESWIDFTALPSPAGECMAGVLSTGLHLCGGRKPGTGNASRWDEHIDTDMHILCPAGSDQWLRAAPMPVPRNSGAAAVIGDRLHVVGGRTVARINLADHHVYEPAEDRWRKAAPMPLAQAGLAAAAVSGSLYAFGGEAIGDDKRVFAQCWRYDPATDSWSALPDMPNPRHGLGAVALDDRIYVIGGALSVGGKDTSDLVEILHT